EERPHRAVLADDAVEAEPDLQLRAQLGVLLLQPSLVDRLPEPARDLRQLERLDQEIDRAQPDRLDRFFDTPEPGDDDGADRRIALDRVAEHLHAVTVG